MNRRTTVVAAMILLAVATIAGVTAAQARRGRSSAAGPQAKPPRWDYLSVQEVFFADATKELGQIPSSSNTTRPGVTAPGDPTMPASTGPAPTGTPRSEQLAWSKLIATEALEDEIKMLVPLVTETTKSPRKFKGGGYRKARRDYSLLATLFGVIAQFDDDVRWRSNAAAMRDALARVGFNCKAGSDQSFREAKDRSEDLASIMRGESPELPDPMAELNWPQVADRQPLMLRMETAQGQLSIWTSSRSEFARNQDQLRHETQILAMLSEVLKDQEYEYADDESFQEHLAALQQSCLDLLEAVRQDALDKAQDAAGAIYQSCNACHDGFKG